MKSELTESGKNAIDVFSAVTVLATLVDMLPSIAAIFTIFWTAIRIWETDTVRGWLGKGKSNSDER